MASEDCSPHISTCIGAPDIIFPKSASVHFIAENYHNLFTERLVTMRKKRILTDVTLKSGDGEIPAHKNVLAAASGFFHDKFCSEDTASGKSDILEVETVDKEILVRLVDFIYTAQTDLTTDNVQELCAACHLFDLIELKEGCDSFMSKHVEPENAMSLYVFSKLHNLELTLRESRACLLTQPRNIFRLAPASELKIMSEMDIIDMISSDDLVGDEEAVVFRLVEKWVQVDPTERMQSVDRIMEHVRLSFCPPPFLADVVHKSPIMKSAHCLNLLHEAKDYHLFPQKRQSDSPVRRMKPRVTYQQLVLLDGDDSAGGKCWWLCENKEEWKELTQLPQQGLRYFKACVSGHDIIVTGGYTGSTIRSSWAFSLHDRKWTTLPPMIECRYSHAVVSVEGEVYVLGGLIDGSVICNVEKLGIKREQWTQKAPMKAELHNHAAVSVGQDIYVMAGCDKSGASLMTQKYNVVSDQWEVKANMPQQCHYGSTAVLNGKICVVGSGDKCCTSYSPKQDTWCLHTTPPQCVNNCAAVIWKGKIVLGGGYSRSDVEEYDCDGDKWSVWQPSLPVKMCFHTLLSVNRFITEA